MPRDTVLNLYEPSLDDVRRWGYDEHLFFLEMDEDQVVARDKYLGILIELAADPACPKQEYALDLLYQLAQFELAHRHRLGCDRIAGHVPAAIATSDAPLLAWTEYFSRIYDYLKSPRPFSDTEAAALAYDLVIGRTYPGRNLVRTGRMVSGFTEFDARTVSCSIYFYVNQESGGWLIEPFVPVDSIEGSGLEYSGY